MNNVQLLLHQLKEAGGAGPLPTPDRTALAFRMFDDILDHLGVFKEVSKLLRDEFFGSLIDYITSLTLYLFSLLLQTICYC